MDTKVAEKGPVIFIRCKSDFLPLAGNNCSSLFHKNLGLNFFSKKLALLKYNILYLQYIRNINIIKV